MQGKKEFNQRIYYDFNLESVVPDNHLLKRIDSFISFEFVRDKTKSYYSHTGKPSIDPVVLIKMLLIGYLFDIRSERRLAEEVSLNLAYRWYIGYDLDEQVPDHSIFSKARARFGKVLFIDIFEEILKKAVSYGLVAKENLLIDSTIVKANASTDSLVEVDLSPEQYWRELDESEKEKYSENTKQISSSFIGKIDKKRIGKNRRNKNASYLKKRSTTDPDATMFYRSNKGGSLSYKAHISAEQNGFITAVAASPSSIHDTGAVPELLEMHEKILGTPSFIAADTKYGSEECLKYLQDKGIKTAILPEVKNNRPGLFGKEKFKYDSKIDCYICPNKKILNRRSKSYTLNRINYSAKKHDCLNCSLRSLCLKPGIDNPRRVTHYDSDYYNNARTWYYSDHGKILQKLRSCVIEGIMGNTKNYHGMERAKFRGRDKVHIQFLLTASVINLKKMVKMLEINGIKQSFLGTISRVYQFIQNILESRLNVPVFSEA